MLTVQFYRCLLPEHTVSWMEPQILFVLSDGFTGLSAAALFEHSLQMTLLFDYLLSSSLSL